MRHWLTCPAAAYRANLWCRSNSFKVAWVRFRLRANQRDGAPFVAGSACQPASVQRRCMIPQMTSSPSDLGAPFQSQPCCGKSPSCARSRTKRFSGNSMPQSGLSFTSSYLRTRKSENSCKCGHLAARRTKWLQFVQPVGNWPLIGGGSELSRPSQSPNRMLSGAPPSAALLPPRLG